MYCKNCGKELSESASFCGNCGAIQVNESATQPTKQKKRKSKKKALLIFFIIVAAFFLIILIAAGSGDDSNSNNNDGISDSTNESASVESEYITYEEYEKIQNGMTYNEVVKIIGCEGQVVSSSTYGDANTVTYSWSSKDMGGVTYGATIVFIDGVVTGKSQIGLDIVDDVSNAINDII